MAYGAGLMTGLLHFGGPVGVTAVLLLPSLLGRATLTTVVAAAVLGRTGAEIALASERSACTVRLPPDRMNLSLVLLEPADSGGGKIAVRPVRAGCAGPVVARWPANRPVGAGYEAHATGRWLPRPGPGGRAGGTLVVTAVDTVSGRPGVTASTRTALAGASHTLYGARAGMVEALVLGRRGGIDPELQQEFARSGLVHLLSISGFHVGLITAWVFLLLRAARVGRSRSLIAAATASVAYVGFLGWPPPATRAAALAVLGAFARLRQRHVQADALLSSTCLCVLLVDPWAILDLGGWLSAAALWGATRVTRWSDGALGTGFWWRTLAASVGATLATAPITAAALGTVAPIGILLNFAAIPLAAVAVPGVLASLLLHPLVRPLAEALAAGAGLGLHLLELLAGAGAAVPGGHLELPPGSVSGVTPWVLLLGGSLWALGERNTVAEAGRRAGWVAMAALWVMLPWGAIVGRADGAAGLTLHFLDVGQGDGAVLRTPGGHWIVIDAGPAGERGDAGRRVVAPFLARHGARGVALAVVSHAHADHLGGIPAVLDRFPAGLLLEPGALVADPLYDRFLALLRDRGLAWHPGRTGEHFTIDGVGFTVLHPDPGWAGWGEDVNEDSLVLLVEYRDFQALFAGDAGFPAEDDMRGRVRRVDLLKVGHHGSRGSTGDEWLDSLRPRVAVISVGVNDYGHPAGATLARLAAHGVEVRRTDRDGEVDVTTDGRRMTVRSARGWASYDVR
jgi:competence protein ComEC